MTKKVEPIEPDEWEDGSAEAEIHGVFERRSARGYNYRSPEEVLSLWRDLYRVTGGFALDPAGSLRCGHCGRLLCHLYAEGMGLGYWPEAIPREWSGRSLSPHPVPRPARVWS